MFAITHVQIVFGDGDVGTGVFEAENTETGEKVVCRGWYPIEKGEVGRILTDDTTPDQMPVVFIFKNIEALQMQIDNLEKMKKIFEAKTLVTQPLAVNEEAKE